MVVLLPSATEPENGATGGGALSEAPPHCVEPCVILNGTWAIVGTPRTD